ncbi:DUF1345 domain-containing protein [Sphingomonas sp.]|jgi:uncharacterized membrane protein|uniref:DUF1345 domain-containing protein n=1 Tax=Sphingomonas sp. TaxID=28214 RepID=UPI00389FF925
MKKPDTIGNKIAPPRFLLFMVILLVATPAAALLIHNWWLGMMAGFNIAALVFLISCVSLLSTREEAEIRRHAAENDANRVGLLVLTGTVVTVLLVAITAEVVGRNPEPTTKLLIVLTLILAWLFSNLVYALHYAHLAYMSSSPDCDGFDFPGTPQPVYWDFVYFSFTCGMAFATSDVQISTERIRKVVTFHCLAAFGFNIGVLAFSINLLASSAG